MVYTMYIPALCNIHGICMVYTIHIPCKIFIGVPDVVEYVLLVPASIARPPGRPPVCLRAIQAPAHALNQITLKHWQVYSLLLGSTLLSA